MMDKTLASITKMRQVSNGVSLCRLTSGAFALAVHDGGTRAIVELSDEELRRFLDEVAALVRA